MRPLHTSSSSIPGVLGMPPGVSLPLSNPLSVSNKSAPNRVRIGNNEANAPRAINFYADRGGCGYWRMGWPEYLMNCRQKALITGAGVMITEGNFYRDIKAIKLQRQSTPNQFKFAKALKDAQSTYKYKLIYEVDDIIFGEDIPEYNACKHPFVANSCRQSMVDTISLMDEFTVTCNFMKEYYRSKTGFNNITVVPNYPPRFWIDRYFNPYKLEKEYNKNKKRPRVLYSGSGVHVDMANQNKQVDDFYYVVDSIIKARKDFKFIWKGCYPLKLKQYIDSGEMEYYPWCNLHDYPKGILDTNPQLTFAPLLDNIFNKAKSNVKMLEAGALGIPGAYQDICTYSDAHIKFTTGAELIDQLKYITKDTSTYMNCCNAVHNYVDQMWLDDHLDEHYAIYFSEYGSQERNRLAPALIDINPEQRFTA
jgi:hypothetical protein